MAWTNERDKALRERAQQVIPGGMYGHMSTRLLPSAHPQFFSRGRGCRIWDVDDNEYVDFMCAYGPNLLGYGDPGIEAAVDAQRALGDSLNGPGQVMVELAERFVEQISHAAWAIFCKNGTDATTVATVLARAAAHGFSLRQTGPAQMPQILFEDDPDHRVGYAWTAEALRHGAYFHPYHNMFLSAAHADADIDAALAAADAAFESVRRERDQLPPVAQLTGLLEARARLAATASRD